jgi:hypothetical protein
MKSMTDGERVRGIGRRRAFPWSIPVAAAVIAACGADPEAFDENSTTNAGESEQGATAPPEDGLADGFSTFLEQFTTFNFDAEFRMGLGFHPGLSTERLTTSGGAVLTGGLLLDLNTGRVNATLDNARPAPSCRRPPTPRSRSVASRGTAASGPST